MITLSLFGRPLLCGSALVGLFVLSSHATAQDSGRPTPRFRDVSLSGLEPFVAAQACVHNIADQMGGCLQASSSPTLGMLYPYPGLGNNFTSPAFVGGGQGNTASGTHATVAGGLGNMATEDRATVGGGSLNVASGPISTVAGGVNNDATGSRAVIGGGTGNTASSPLTTVGGGEDNTASGRSATVGGGTGNSAGYYATISGGEFNTASGNRATVGGGGNNTAGGAFNTTVAGGRFNSATGNSATVGGGRQNMASGNNAVVPGGEYNVADGNFSFAGGRRAMANHEGSFVWADSQDLDKASSVADEFNVYCSGGARFFTNSAASTGVLLAAGAGSWTAVSDLASKENVVPVDPRSVLERVLALPISTWNYRTQSAGIRHMGPMAQDFHAAFGLGLGERTIDTVDPDGVALAAIQGLNAELTERLAEKDAELDELRTNQAALEEQLLVLSERLEELTSER